MIYTSGTTGRPKGVRRPLPDGPPPSATRPRRRWRCSRACLARRRRPPPPRAPPLYHAGPAHLLRRRVVARRRPGPHGPLRRRAVPRADREHHGVTSTFLVPIHFVRLLRLPEEVRRRYDLSSLRLVVHGSAPVAVDVKEQMIDWLGPVLYEFYGGTEGGGVGIDSHTWLERTGSVGRPSGRGLEMVILDDDGTPSQPVRRGPRVLPRHEPAALRVQGRPREDGRGVARRLLHARRHRLPRRRRLPLPVRSASRRHHQRWRQRVPGADRSRAARPSAVADCCVVGVPDDEWGERSTRSCRSLGATPSGARRADRPLPGTTCRLSGAAQRRPRRRAAPHRDGQARPPHVRDRYWVGRDRKI